MDPPKFWFFFFGAFVSSYKEDINMYKWIDISFKLMKSYENLVNEIRESKGNYNLGNFHFISLQNNIALSSCPVYTLRTVG